MLYYTDLFLSKLPLHRLQLLSGIKYGLRHGGIWPNVCNSRTVLTSHTCTHFKSLSELLESFELLSSFPNLIPDISPTEMDGE